MHGINQYAGMFGIDIRVDAMTQVEHVTRAMSEGFQYTGDTFADHVRRRVQYGRVEVALQGNALTNALARHGEVG